MVDFQSDIPLRMFLLPEDTQPNILINVLLTGCKANPLLVINFSQMEVLESWKKSLLITTF